MARNRYIYTLADQALVIDSALKSGGTWTGAVENLKHGWVPLYVRVPGEGAGNAALVADGGLPFTLTADSTDTLTELFAARVVEKLPSDSGVADVQQSFLAFEPVAPVDDAFTEVPAESVLKDLPAPPRPDALAVQPTLDIDLLVETLDDSRDVKGRTIEVALVAEQSARVNSSSTLDMYADFTVKLASLLSDRELSEDEISTLLCIEKSQAKAWLKRASEAGLIEKLKKPVRYLMGSQSSLC